MNTSATTEETTTAATTSDALPPSARMLRVLQVLKKALDVSVSQASTVDLRAFFEEECRDEPELLHQLFAATELKENAEAQLESPLSVSAAQHAAVAGELSAQALQNLRQRIDAAFRALAQRHGVNAKLTALEQAIEDAQRLKMKELASEEIEEKTHAAEESKHESDASASASSPEEVIRNERIRVMEAEKQELEAMVRQLQMQKEERQTRLNIKREMAMNAIEDLQQVSSHLQHAAALAQDYASS
ncbi:hypothetical protein PINS_up019539 [Pythium insidiosum]|nr:hypothetical protein PINS_up019539 [Pythium insidiosum]